MGQTTLVDIIGSFIIGGMLFLVALRLNAQAVENSAQNNANYLLQRNLVVLVTLLENDFRQIGYCATPGKIQEPAKSVLTADSSRFKFLTDLWRNGVGGNVDTVEYWLGLPSEIPETTNPRDCYLYRKVNSNSADKWKLGITMFRFHYYATGTELPLSTPVADPTNVGLMQLDVQLESPQRLTQQQYNVITTKINGRDTTVADTSDYQIYWRQIRMTSKSMQL